MPSLDQPRLKHAEQVSSETPGLEAPELLPPIECHSGKLSYHCVLGHTCPADPSKSATSSSFCLAVRLT
jgi:hypothetical protein